MKWLRGDRGWNKSLRQRGPPNCHPACAFFCVCVYNFCGFQFKRDILCVYGTKIHKGMWTPKALFPIEVQQPPLSHTICPRSVFPALVGHTARGSPSNLVQVNLAFVTQLVAEGRFLWCTHRKKKKSILGASSQSCSTNSEKFDQ